MKSSVLFLLVFSVSFGLRAEETITFPSKDGVTITADLHMVHPDTATFILLFHQAGWSRGEYLEIAPTLNQLGFNCMAVDLRSGNLVNGVRNLTNQSATAKMKQTRYIDAEQDMVASIELAERAYAKGKLVIWGSSYSSALALKLAGQYNEKVDGVLAFSPGEYFKSMGKGSDYVTSFAKNIYQPVFITSARNEKQSWWPIYESIPSQRKTFYLPSKTSGNHGSRALFTKFPDHKEYWEYVIPFLHKL